MFWFHFLTCFC